jgi:opacity protein-like surface antigen
MIKKTHRIGHVALLLVTSVLSIQQVWAVQSETIDETGWYATLEGGTTGSTGSTFTQVTEGNVRIPIKLTGHTAWDRGTLGSVAVGRQMRIKGERGSEDEMLVRVEGEWLHARLKREGFHVAAVNANLSDAMDANALFLNGLVQIASTEKTRWWLGAGIGWAKARLPDAVSATYPCGCLGAAGGTGTAYRVKLQVERLLSEKTALFGELGYVKLPSQQTIATSFPKTHYDTKGFTHISIGYRIRF